MAASQGRAADQGGAASHGTAGGEAGGGGEETGGIVNSQPQLKKSVNEAWRFTSTIAERAEQQ